MQEEEKKLLLTDLTARLPYGVIVNHYQGAKCLLKYIDLYTFGAYVEVLNSEYFKDVLERGNRQIFEFKPYLRPLSSMTEEERLDLAQIGIYIDKGDIMFDAYDYRDISLLYVITPYIDWLNQHHFDYRGLIGKGLALEAPDGMY